MLAVVAAAAVPVALPSAALAANARARPARTITRRTPISNERWRDYVKDARRFASTLANPGLLPSRAKESRAIRRRGLVLRGVYTPEVRPLDFGTVRVKTLRNALRLLDREYVDLTNATAVDTSAANGKTRSFLIARAVRPYEVEVSLKSGKVNYSSPAAYVSDVVLFEKVAGRYVPRSVLVESRPDKRFVFEDPRISVVYVNGKRRMLLSGTDLSPHLAGVQRSYVMNRYIELLQDKDGMLLPAKVNQKTGRPRLRDLSPRPRVGTGGTVVDIDAKNGTVYQNEDGEIVVRTRFRPDFDVPDLKGAGLRWSYGEQVFVFRNFSEFRQYNWAHALHDLTAGGKPLLQEGKPSSVARTRPIKAKVLYTEKDLHNFLVPQVSTRLSKGAGPGTIPVRLRREGDRLFISEAKGAPETLIGTIAPGIRKDFPLRDGDVKFMSFDHEVLAFKDRGFGKRGYPVGIKLFDRTLTEIDAYYAHAIQPKRKYERGKNGGIVDLHHAYPVGRLIRGGIVQVFAGTSDAHTAQYDVDVMKLLTEMSQGSPAWKSGQVYRLGSRLTSVR